MKIFLYCLLGAAISNGGPHKPAHKIQSHDRTQENAEQKQYPLPPAPLPVETVRSRPCNKQEPCYTNNQSEYDLLPWWRRPEWMGIEISAAYSIITLGMFFKLRRQVADAQVSSAESSRIANATLKVLARQGLSMQRQTTVLRRTSKAALLHAKALINIERPWVLVSSEPSAENRNHHRIMVKNVGRTPALLFGHSENCGFGNAGSTISDTPKYSELTAYDPPRILLPGESSQIILVTDAVIRWAGATPEVVEDWKLYKQFAFPYGYIDYRDLLDNETGKAHRTKWCFWFAPGKDGRESQLIKVDLGGYAGHT